MKTGATIEKVNREKSAPKFSKFLFGLRILGNFFKAAKESRASKVAFLVRRYHTNMIPMVESLLEQQIEVCVVAMKQEIIEHYGILKPILISEDEKLESIIARLPFLPNVVIIRETSSIMIQINQWAQKHGASSILYHQKPLRREKGVAGLMQDLKRLRRLDILGLPLNNMTPVDFEAAKQSGAPKKILVQPFNFPMKARTVEDMRTNAGQKLLRILMVGKMAQPRKRHFWLIDALKSSGAECHLTICGAGNDLKSDDGTRSLEYYHRLHEEARKMHQHPFITFELRENVDFSEMGKLYYQSDIFVLPSEQEHFGISLLEAMSYGCACIAADTNGSSHHVTHGHDGLVFEESNFEQFEQFVHQLLSNTNQRQSLQRNALETIRTNHNYQQFASLIQSIA